MKRKDEGRKEGGEQERYYVQEEVLKMQKRKRRTVTTIATELYGFVDNGSTMLSVHAETVRNKS